MENSLKKNPMIIHGVQAVVLVGTAQNIFNQKILLIQDRDDRGRGDNTRMYGLPGGAIEEGETPSVAILRELFEETSLKLQKGEIKKVGCFTKVRPNGLTNNNHLFAVELDRVSQLVTNDPDEVSKIHILELQEILELATQGLVHEGSIRLIFHFLNKNQSGSLNEPIRWQKFCF